MPHCTHCGNEMLEFAKFCPACGHQATQPFAVPELSLKRTSSSLPLGEYLKTGWGLFLSYPGGFIGFFLAFIGTNFILKYIPFIGPLASFVIAAPVYMGFFIVSAKLLQKQPPQFSDFFLGFRFFVPLLLTGLVGAVFAAIGLLLLVIPGIYLLVGYLFAHFLVVDRRLDFWQALETSRRTVQPMWFGMFAFVLLLALLNLAGVVALGIGLLVTMPLSWCTLAAAYADIFGLQSDYSEGFPDIAEVEPSKPGE